MDIQVGRMRCLFLLVFLLGIVASDNSTFDGSLEIVNGASSFENDQVLASGEWTPCSRSCGGGISRQQKRCRRKPCKGRAWNIKYKVCNAQPCDNPSDFRSEQCSAFDSVPYSEQLLKWYPYYDPSRPCALICRGEQQSSSSSNVINAGQDSDKPANERPQDRPLTSSAEDDDSDESIVVQLADKVQDGTKCYPDSQDVCINGECTRVGCDMRVGSNKNRDACGICGGDGSTCNVKYAWTLESTSACSESCGGGFKIATSVCKSTGSDENIVDNSKCDPELKPDKVLLPCNTHPCSTKWLTGEWSKCSVSCGGGSRNRAVFCIEENGNATSKLPDYKCSASHKPKYQEICNTFSCPMWESGEWTDCSSSCGRGLKTRNVECRDGNGRLSDDCDPSQRPRSEQECRGTADIDCSSYGDEMTQPLMQSYPPAPVPEKLIDQPVPSQSTFVADEWSACSVSCGEGVRHREVHCKIFLEFSRTIAKLPDHQCSGPKPIETEKCTMEPCGLIENSLAYRIDTVGDSSYAESSLTDSFKSSSSAVSGGSSGSGGGGGYESNVKVAPGSSTVTSYSWKEAGYTDCSATCLGGVQDLIIICVRDDTGKTVVPLLCTAETKPESRIRVCNDHPCPPRWNTSEFSACMKPCGLGIQTREVTCIHEVTRGTGNTVAVPSHMCPQPPPVDRQYCNVWDCPVEWNVGEWSKCSKTCGGGTKKRKVSCEQIMAQGHMQSRHERSCSSPKPHTEKPCNSRPCNQLSAGAQPIISSKNTTFIQDDPNKKVNLDIGGQATIFQGTPVIKIRCPVKKFNKAHIIWKKDRKDLQKSKKHKINKKGALKIVKINLTDSGIYTCWAGQTNAAMNLTVKPMPRDVMSNEEVLRSGNAVHQRQGAQLSSAPVNSEPYYGIYGENTQESRQESQKQQRTTTEKPRRKKQKQQSSPSPSDSTGQYDYSVTPLHQPVESATSSASTLMPHLSQIITTIKSYWPFQDSTYSGSERNSGSTYYTRNDPASMTTSTTTGHRSHIMDDFPEPDRFDSTRTEFDFFHGNTAIPDNTFGPDEERIFIDDDAFDTQETVFSIEHKDISRINEITSTKQQHQTVPTVTMVNYENHPTHARHHHGSTEAHSGRNQRGTHKDEIQSTPKPTEERGVIIEAPIIVHPRNELKQEQPFKKESEEEEEAISTSSSSEESLLKITDDDSKQNMDKDVHDTPVATLPSSSPSFLPSSPFVSSEEEEEISKNENETLTSEVMNNTTVAQVSGTEEEAEEGQASKQLTKTSKKASMEVDATVTPNVEANSVTPVVLSNEDKNHEPTIGSVAVFSKAKDDLIFEWVTTDWSRCSQTCGGGGFQMRGAQCTVRSAKNDSNTTKIASRTVIGASLCEDAGYPVPEKVRPCGAGRCPQWFAGEWSPCETSRCFNWKTAMQRREISCRLTEDTDDKIENSTVTDPNKCDEAMRPPQRQECYNDACKGVWRVGEWSSCSASCEDDGIKYRILQCVWFGTKKPAGNACRDIPRPPVMKTCRGPPCPKSPDECKDHSQLCGRVKLMNMCRVPLYGKQCCKSCHPERHL